jgi:hypothetical protein
VTANERELARRLHIAVERMTVLAELLAEMDDALEMSLGRLREHGVIGEEVAGHGIARAEYRAVKGLAALLVENVPNPEEEEHHALD